jgi:hypothetical protein
MARPRLEIDEDTVEKLASIMCTMEEMSHILGCSVDTLERRFADIINKGRNSGKMSLRRWQWEACKKGNSALLIWMGKQHLGQKEKLETELSGEGISIKIDHDDAGL